MKYLVTHNTEIVNQGNAAEWGVKIIMPFDSIEKDLSCLPLTDDHIIYFVPTIINSNNPLNYDGATLALRILMYYVRCKRTNIDIVLMGNETERDFMLTFEYPNIMKIPGIHYIRFNKSVVKDYIIPQKEKLLPEEYLPYLENLNLKLPSSFKSTHSLTNEWCLYKWNSFMDFEANTELLKGLYFDYLITVERLKRVANKTASEYLKQRIDNLPTGSRLLIIDDNSGWHDFFDKMFPNGSIVELHFLGMDFKKMKYEEIEAAVQQELESFQPDVIILDYRLMEDKDAEIKDDMKQISGYKILVKVLKGTAQKPLPSFGRQVLMFTATSRIENILLLEKGNADGFILKEKPETYNGKEITKDLITHMINDLQRGFKRSKFLIPLNDILTKIETLTVEFPSFNPEPRVTIEAACHSVRQLTQNNDLSLDILKLAFLNLFTILESLKNHGKINTFINTEGSRIGLDSYTFSLWEEIDEIRNCLAHGDKIIKKGRFRNQEISVAILKENIIFLSEFIFKFVQLFLKN